MPHLIYIVCTPKQKTKQYIYIYIFIPYYLKTQIVIYEIHLAYTPMQNTMHISENGLHSAQVIVNCMPAYVIVDISL